MHLGFYSRFIVSPHSGDFVLTQEKNPTLLLTLWKTHLNSHLINFPLQPYRGPLELLSQILICIVFKNLLKFFFFQILDFTIFYYIIDYCNFMPFNHKNFSFERTTEIFIVNTLIYSQNLNSLVEIYSSLTN